MHIEFTYRRTSRLAMRVVKNGDVHVSAPLGMPKKKVEEFVSDHREWIAEARKKTAERHEQRTAFFQQLPLSTPAEKEEAARKLQGLVMPMIERYAPLMGVRPSTVSFKPMVSRWGVCKVKDGSICCSTYLLLLPHWCIEHVVVHELAHLKVPNHSPRFYAVMDKYFPRWKEARKETRKLTNASH